MPPFNSQTSVFTMPLRERNPSLFFAWQQMTYPNKTTKNEFRSIWGACRIFNDERKYSEIRRQNFSACGLGDSDEPDTASFYPK